MPIIKSAKKRVRQQKKRTIRNSQTKNIMKTHIKKVLVSVKDNNLEEANKNLQMAYKLIDTAAKKNVIHKRNAANKKSKLAKAVSGISATDKVKTEPKPAKNVKAEKSTAKKEQKEKAETTGETATKK